MPAFATRAEYHAFLEREGLAHVGKWNLEALAPFVDAALWPQLNSVGARRRLADVTSVETWNTSRAWLAEGALREAIAAAIDPLLEAERAHRREAETELTARRELPTDAAHAGLTRRLLSVRDGFSTTLAPRPMKQLSQDHLRFEARTQSYVFTDWLPAEMPLREGGGFARPRVVIRFQDEQVVARCTCGAMGCTHALAAIDTLLLRVRAGLPQRERNEFLRPKWERSLQALELALATAGDAAPRDVTFRLEIDEGDVLIDGFIGDMRANKTQLFEHTTDLRERLVAALLPESGRLASRTLVDALVGHPGVRLLHAPDKHVTVERAQVGLVAQERGFDVRLGLGVDGAPVPAALEERIRSAQPDELLFLWDEGKRRLTLLELKPQMRAAIPALQDATTFPSESRTALLETLSRWAERIPVALPRSVLGQRLPPERQLVLRLTPQTRGGVEVELRVRPLPDAPSMPAGGGLAEIFLRRGDEAVHTRRDLDAEHALAMDTLSRLPLGDAEPSPLSPFIFDFPRSEQVFDLLAAAQEQQIILEWIGRPLRVIGIASARSLRVQLEQRSELFGALGELSVSGERVEVARLVEAVRRQARFVQVSSHDCVEIGQALREHLQAVADHSRTRGDDLLIGPAAVEALRGLVDAGAQLQGDRAWKRLVQRADDARRLQLEVPATVHATLRPYQREGFAWLMRLAALGVGGVLADDMGLGKTLQALCVLAARAAQGPALVVAPTSVGWNWKDEARRFVPSLRTHVYAEVEDREGQLESLGAGDVVIVSYGLLVRDAKRLSKVRWSTAVFDEAQELKNATTQRFLAAKSMVADFTFALSGTPIENHLGELWSLFALVFPALLGSWDEFRSRHALVIEKHIDPAAGPALARVIRPYLLRRTKSEVETELPARTDVRVPVTLSAQEWTLYEDTRLAALSDLESSRGVMREQNRRVQVLASLTRLRLAAAHPRLLDERSTVPSSKVHRLMRLLEELHQEGQRALVFSQFTSLLDLVEPELRARGLEFLRLDGSTPARERKTRVKAFQEGQAPVFLISLKAGSTGLNLTAATNVVLLDPWWNPAVEQQASDRAHRPGQSRPVTVFRMVSSNTIEEQMLLLHERKRALVERVLSGVDAAAKISTDELMGLLSAREIFEDPEQD